MQLFQQQPLPHFSHSFIPSSTSAEEDTMKESENGDCYSYQPYTMPAAQQHLYDPPSQAQSSDLSSTSSPPKSTNQDYQSQQHIWQPSFYPSTYGSQYPVSSCQYVPQYSTLSSNNPHLPVPTASDNSTIWQQISSLQNINAATANNNIPTQHQQQQHYSQFPFTYNTKTEALQTNPNRTSFQCVRCGLQTGDFWQKDTTGNYLCQSCYSPSTVSNNNADILSMTKRPSIQKPISRKQQTSKRTGLQCSNCKTDNTTLWRRNTDGQQVCNACGLYFKLHKTHRPASMRKEVLQTRKRKTKRKQTVCMKFMDQDYPSMKPQDNTSAAVAAAAGLMGSLDNKFEQLQSSPPTSATISYEQHQQQQHRTSFPSQPCGSPVTLLPPLPYQQHHHLASQFPLHQQAPPYMPHLHHPHLHLSQHQQPHQFMTHH